MNHHHFMDRADGVVVGYKSANSGPLARDRSSQVHHLIIRASGVVVTHP